VSTQGATTVSLQDASRIEDNGATDHGGGIYMGPDGLTSVTLEGDSSVRGNRANELGGGIVVQGTLLLKDQASIHGNHAGRDGGGLFLWAGSVRLDDDASMTQNRAERHGGAIHIIGAGKDLPVTLTGASTITDNSAGTSGGGIYRGLDSDGVPAGIVTLYAPSAMRDNLPDQIVPPL
jgi:hypothetical protein